MSYGVYGSAAAMVFVVGVGAYSAIDRSANFKPATASVAYIDRTCNFIETTTGENGRKTARGLTDSCNSTDEWEKVREKRNRKISGNATVHVTYTAPQDGTYRSSELQFTGRDDEFYELKAGDEVRILVSNTDPAKIRKA